MKLTNALFRREPRKLRSLRQMHPAWNIHLSDSGVYWASPVGEPGISLRAHTAGLMTEAIREFQLNPAVAA